MCGFVPTQSHGGNGGNAFSDDLTQTCQLVKVLIRHGSGVDGIQGTYLLPSGAEASGAYHGGDGGSPTEFQLEAGEYIVRVAGRSGGRVDQLTFITNTGRSYGPYGGNGGNAFSIDGIKVGGFFGRSGSRLDAIGFYTPGKCPNT
jgi:hypothetical protein